MKRTVFICYRRKDGAHARLLHDRLAARLGARRVYMDVVDIPKASHFENVVKKQIEDCGLVLVVVGPQWPEEFTKREPSAEEVAAGVLKDDFTRGELQLALQKKKNILPVCVGGAHMPARNELPPDICGFTRYNKMEVRDEHLDEDAAKIVDWVAGGRSWWGAFASLPFSLKAAAVLLVAVSVAVAAWQMQPARLSEMYAVHLTGKVVDGAGNGVRGLRISVDEDPPDQVDEAATSGADGAFSLRFSVPNTRFHLRISGADVGSANAPVCERAEANTMKCEEDLPEHCVRSPADANAKVCDVPLAPITLEKAE